MRLFNIRSAGVPARGNTLPPPTTAPRTLTIFGLLLSCVQAVHSQNPAPEILARTFSVPRAAFLPENPASPASSSSQPVDWQQTARNAFIRQGFDFARHEHLKLFYNDRTEILNISGTLHELALIENLLKTLTVSPPLVSLRVTVAQLDARPFADLNKLLDSFKESRLQPIPPADAGHSPDILVVTEADAKTVCRQLEQKEGVDLFTCAPAQTVSGRQARLSLSDAQAPIIIPPFHAPQGNQSGFYFNAE